jgi:monothiol glutaredoxin
MDTIEQIKQQIADHPIIIYMKGSPDAPQCGFSALAIQILKATGVKFAYINVLQYPEIRQELPKYANWPTFPQLYIKGELIGGSDIMKELYENGELQDLIADLI